MVLACIGDIPTLETLASVDLLRQHLPELAIRVINIVGLMRLQPDTEHPHGLSDRGYPREHGEDDPAIANWTWPTAPDRDLSGAGPSRQRWVIKSQAPPARRPRQA